MTKTALVTGGTGFIGSHLVEALVEKGYKVKVLDSLIKGKLSSIQYLIDKGKVEFIEGDIRNRDIVDKAINGVDYVFHTAGIHIQRSSDNIGGGYGDTGGVSNLQAATGCSEQGMQVRREAGQGQAVGPRVLPSAEPMPASVRIYPIQS